MQPKLSSLTDYTSDTGCHKPGLCFTLLGPRVTSSEAPGRDAADPTLKHFFFKSQPENAGAKIDQKMDEPTPGKLRKKPGPNTECPTIVQ